MQQILSDYTRLHGRNQERLAHRVKIERNLKNRRYTHSRNSWKMVFLVQAMQGLYLVMHWSQVNHSDCAMDQCLGADGYPAQQI